jgi:3-dehydroquinate synthase
LLRRKRVAVITDDTVASHYLLALAAALEAQGIAMAALSIPPGESSKGWEPYARCSEWLLEQKIERRDVVIAFGGGVVGDLVGFACATLRRGVRFVQIPTTLLAQVDSSVGGKTGINTTQGKNLIGAFHQPSLVLADIGALNTLAPRDFLAGYGEVVKYGLLGDSAFFEWLELNGLAMAAGDMALRQYAVKRSVEMKAGIVSRDQLVSARRYVIVAIFIVAAVITPPDVVSQLMLAAPLLLLFEGSLVLMRITEKRRAREAAAEVLAQETSAEQSPAE